MELSEAIARLLLAAGLSGLIGFEREVAQKAAGMRTHMLVGLGAGLFTLLSAEAFAGADPARVAAQVVSGVGFLGAGAIFRHGFTVRGLTTAAGLWAAAAVGMAAGIGETGIALAAALVALLVLYVVGVIQWLLRGRRQLATTVIAVRMADPEMVQQAIGVARNVVGPEGEVTVQEIGLDKATLQVTVEPRHADAAMVALRAITGVERVSRVDG